MIDKWRKGMHNTFFKKGKSLLHKKNSRGITLTSISQKLSMVYIYRENMNEILTACGLTEVIVKAIMISYINTKSMVMSPDGGLNYFDITD